MTRLHCLGLAVLTTLGARAQNLLLQPFEPCMVVAAEAEVYDGSRRAPLRLFRGDVVAARPHEVHRDWLELQAAGRLYQARSGQFAGLAELRVNQARVLADLRSRATALADRIAANETTLEQTYAAVSAVRFDSTVKLRYQELVPVVAPSAPWQGRRPPAVQMEIVYRYVDKIDPAGAAALIRRWERETDALEKETTALRQEARDLQLQTVEAEANRAYVDWRFAAYNAGAGILDSEPYVSVADRAGLYDGELLVQELDAGEVILARLDRETPDRLQIRAGNRLLTTRRRAFHNRIEVESRQGKRAAWLAQSIWEAEAEVRRLEERRLLLERVLLAADYGADVAYLTLRSYPFFAAYPGRAYYLPPVVPLEAVEVVDAYRARRLIRDIRRDLAKLADQAREIRTRLVDWQRELAAMQPRLEDLRRRMDAAR